MFTSQGQAKRFFIEKITSQAAIEGHPLSENERWMLSFSESDPDFVVDSARVAAIEAEIPEPVYEDKVAWLIERACSSEVDSHPEALAIYKEAFRALNKGDHYILIMLKRGLAKWIRPWWAFWW